MHHGDMDQQTARGLKELQRRIADAKLPESSLDKTIKIATWNIREFGNPGRKRSDTSLHYIAEILGQFDLIGVVELRDNVQELAQVMRYLGPYWDIIYSDYIEDSGGNHERVGYLFDRRACKFTGLAGNATERRDKQCSEYGSEVSWWRKPFMASFQSGNFDFIVITTHIRWGDKESDRLRELDRLADYVHARTVADAAVDRDIVLMGDFNIPSLDSPLYAAVTKRGLVMPKELAGITGSNLGRDKRYDQILFNPIYDKSITDRAGVLDFIEDGWGALYPEAKEAYDQKFTYELSDHLPLWVMVDTDTETEKLDQILSPFADAMQRRDRGASGGGG